MASTITVLVSGERFQRTVVVLPPRSMVTWAISPFFKKVAPLASEKYFVTTWKA
jgi:hypothetical protein